MGASPSTNVPCNDDKENLPIINYREVTPSICKVFKSKKSMKLSTSIFIITDAFLLTSCGLKSKPNLDRTFLEGYNACVVAHKEAQAKELAA